MWRLAITFNSGRADDSPPLVHGKATLFATGCRDEGFEIGRRAFDPVAMLGRRLLRARSKMGGRSFPVFAKDKQSEVERGCATCRRGRTADPGANKIRAARRDQ
jgi:hypothetical protein